MRIISLLSLIAFAASSANALQSQISETEIIFSDAGSNSIVVSVSGPQGFIKKYEFSGGYASIHANEINNGQTGSYNFNALSVTKVGEEYAEGTDGRSSGIRNIVESDSATGHFALNNGVFVITAEAE